MSDDEQEDSAAAAEAPRAQQPLLPEADLVLDCRGLRCPLPVLRLAVAIEDVEVGGVVAVEASDPASRVDVPAWCRMRGHAFAGSEVADDGTPRHLVRRLR